MGVRILAFLLAVVMNAECGMQNAELFDMERCEVRMMCIEKEVVEVCLELLCDGGICGAVADISYDADAFLLLSCGIEETEGVTFSFFDSGGDLRILIDGAENIARGVRVKFYFGRADGYYGGGVFRANGIEVYSLSDDADICRADADEESVCELVCEGRGDKSESVIYADSIEIIREGNGKVEVVISGHASDDFFAAGFKVFVVEVDSGASESFFVVGIIRGEETFERRVSFTASGNLSFVVTPLAFDRNGAKEGEKRGMWNAECGMQNAECGMQSAE